MSKPKVNVELVLKPTKAVEAEIKKASEIKVGQIVQVVDSVIKCNNGRILYRIYNGFVDLANPNDFWSMPGSEPGYSYKLIKHSKIVIEHEE